MALQRVAIPSLEAWGREQKAPASDGDWRALLAEDEGDDISKAPTLHIGPAAGVRLVVCIHIRVQAIVIVCQCRF
jgi:hypothetical protein